MELLATSTFTAFANSKRNFASSRSLSIIMGKVIKSFFMDLKLFPNFRPLLFHRRRRRQRGIVILFSASKQASKQRDRKNE